MTRSITALRGALLCVALWGCDDATAPTNDGAVDAPRVDAPAIDTPAVDRPATQDVPAADAPADVAKDLPSVDVVVDVPVSCDAGDTACGGRCVSTQTDPSNCGACETVCPSGQSCVAGRCALPCASPSIQCAVMGAMTCVNPAVDDAHCGSCGAACDSGQHCIDSRCTLVCDTGRIACSGACVDATSNPMHCGACGTVCPTLANATPSCEGGACALRCLEGFGDCDGVMSNGCEVNLRESSAHCGACGMSCAAATGGSALCMAGRCVTSCPTGRTQCGGACVDTDTSAANCGGCGRACAAAPNANATCASGTCGIACSAGFGNCDATAANGCEVNLTNNTASCGACGNVCAAPMGGTTACVASTCQTTCPTGRTACAGRCADTLTDLAHCGACGNACAAGELCTAGRCFVTLTGTEFRLTSLAPRACRLLDHNTVTGDDRGGIAASATQLFYTGDVATGRFSLADLGGGVATASAFDAMFSDLSTQQVYAFGSAAGPFRGTLGGAAYTIDRMFPLNGATGVAGAAVMLSAPIAIADRLGGAVGYFSGAGRAVVANGTRLYDVTLPSGAVRDLGAFTVPTHTACDSQGFWGVAEFFGSRLYVDYVQSSTAIVRTQVYPPGETTVIQSFTNLGDMCAFTVSPSNNRWYWHHEGASQFGGTVESIGYCSMTPGYVFSPGTATFVDACSQSGATRQLMSADDAVGAAVPIGFSFSFFGTAFTTARPSSNGYMVFGSTTVSGSPDTAYYPNTPLPATDRPFPALFVYNSDLYTRSTGVCTATIGASPNRRFVYEGVDEGYCCSITGNLTFEAILNEADGSMDFVYQNIVFPTGDSHNNLVGLQNSGTVGTTFEFVAGGRLTSVVTGTSLHVSFAP